MARLAPLDEATNAKIRKQVEFYFSDSNAPRDKFLLEKINQHPEGYMELATICSFTRMAKLLKIATNQKAEEIPNHIIAQAACALRASEELYVSGDGLAVKRRLPLKPQTEALSEMDERSVFAAPLPFDCTLEGLTEFFKKVGPVRCVRMRRSTATKDFRGSVFVEFDSKELAEEVLKQKLVYEGAPLRLESKNSYMARKIAERKSKAAAGPASNDKPPATADNGQGGPAGGQANGQNDDTHGRSANGVGKRARINWPGDMAARLSNRAAAGPSAAAGSGKPAEPSYEKGLLVRFTIPEEMEVPSDMHFSQVKEAFGGRAGGIVFVEYQMGQRTGFARVDDREHMTSLLERLDENGTIELGTVRAGVEVLDGDEARNFYARAEASRIASDRIKRPGGGEFVVHRNNTRPGNFQGRGGPGRFGKRGRVF